MRSLLTALAVAALGLAACGPSPCARVCQKLASCDGALVTTEAQCTADCEDPAAGHTCANEDAIASCIEGASCEALTSASSRLQCPGCE